MDQNRNYRHELKFEIPYADYVAMRTGFRLEQSQTELFSKIKQHKNKCRPDDNAFRPVFC